MERTVNNKYKIKIDLMPGDGNCLFSAIVHQLTDLQHTHAVFHEAVSVMRRECVRHLYQSAGTYRNLIITEAIEEIRGRKRIGMTRSCQVICIALVRTAYGQGQSR
ncbi:hypothetical protein RP20_CCG009609 [Aedes albopictus]|nr:hypothetical protein RP20_CCG019815 [Aedes albopictus]KXJ76471.1 hypothetical protein RP20_CCG009609 [Aedes albopictus]